MIVFSGGGGDSWLNEEDEINTSWTKQKKERNVNFRKSYQKEQVVWSHIGTKMRQRKIRDLRIETAHFRVLGNNDKRPYETEVCLHRMIILIDKPFRAKKG